VDAHASSKSQTLNLEPQTINPKTTSPKTLNPKPKILTPNP